MREWQGRFADRSQLILAAKTPAELRAGLAQARRANLRLPRLAHLAEILAKEDGLEFDRIPLTSGEARRELLRLNGLEPKNARQKSRYDVEPCR